MEDCIDVEDDTNIEDGIDVEDDTDKMEGDNSQHPTQVKKVRNEFTQEEDTNLVKLRS
jgi:hypothetical protein